jgi:hypothetical protein
MRWLKSLSFYLIAFVLGFLIIGTGIRMGSDLAGVIIWALLVMAVYYLLYAKPE